MAKLYFRYSAMNSGKSTNLLQVAHNYEERGMRVLIAKPEIDTKDNDQISSRLGISKQVDYIIKEDENLFNVFSTENMFLVNGFYDANENAKLLPLSCVIIDEVQFLTEKQIDELYKFASIRDIPVICYGLRTDFRGDGFPGASRLLQLAHSLEEIKTICRCGRKATMNGRMINGEFVSEGPQVTIDAGGAETYESLCSSCHIQKVML